NTREAVAPHNRPSTVPKARHAGRPDGNSLEASNGRAGSRDERVLTTVAWNTDVRYVADEGSLGAMRERPLLVEEPPAAQPGPRDEEGRAKLRGPEREELWITPDTRAATLAPYLDAWRRKVERVGTINYPSAARGAPAQASPVVEVGIAADGSLDRVVIRRTSGNPRLDQAALAILKLASPFDPFPPELAARYRVLRFAYEWQFVGGRVTSGTLSSVPGESRAPCPYWGYGRQAELHGQQRPCRGMRCARRGGSPCRGRRRQTHEPSAERHVAARRPG